MLWLDGALYPDSRAPFDLSDRGLLLGDGVFDTALVLNGRVFRAEAHLRRLIDALALLGHRSRRGQRSVRPSRPSFRMPDGTPCASPSRAGRDCAALRRPAHKGQP